MSAIQIDERTWSLGNLGDRAFFSTNSYLYTGNGGAALINPGPFSEFHHRFDALREVVAVEDVRFFLLTQASPLYTASLPLWYGNGLRPRVIAFWSTAVHLAGYALDLPIEYVYGRRSTVNVLDENWNAWWAPGIFERDSVIFSPPAGGTVFTGEPFGVPGKNQEEQGSGSFIAALTRFHRIASRNEYPWQETAALLRSVAPERICPALGPIHDTAIPALIERLGAVQVTDTAAHSQPEAETAPGASVPPPGGDDATAEMEEQQALNFELQEALVRANEDKIRDPVTQFYNQDYFIEFFRESLRYERREALIFVQIDNIQDFNRRFGSDAGDLALKALGLVLTDTRPPKAVLFRLVGPYCLCVLRDADGETIRTVAEKIRDGVAASNYFFAPLTASIGIVTRDDLLALTVPRSIIPREAIRIGRERLRESSRRGRGIITVETDTMIRNQKSGLVLVISADHFFVSMVERLLTAEGIATATADSAGTALNRIDESLPDVVISDVTLPQRDAFQLIQEVQGRFFSGTVSFILITDQKNENNIRRAFDLDVTYLFEYPVLHDELVGAVRKLLGVPSS